MSLRFFTELMMGESQNRVVELATEKVRLGGKRLVAALNGLTGPAGAQQGKPL
jgi:hypothetical protein